MINLLILALEFAPVQTTGAFRSVKFVKYLRDFGVNPIVVTIAPEQASRIFDAPVNPALLAEVGSDVPIYHLDDARPPAAEGRFGRFLRIFLNLDDSFDRRFRRSLMAKTKAISARHSIDAVYASLPPFGAEALGRRISRELGTPLLLDMRDAWSQWSAGPYPTVLHYRRRLADERRAFTRADQIITVTDQLRTLFLKTHPRLDPGKIHIIPNGFDGEPFAEGEAVTVGAGAKLRIAYVGSYYYQPEARRKGLRLLARPDHMLRYRPQKEDWAYRSPLFFFRAWHRLAQLRPELADRIEFHHVGAVPEWLRPMARCHGVEERCVFHGRVPAQQVQAMLTPMDMLLATSMKVKEGGDYCLASKTFDYLEARKAILAFVTEGAQQDFLAGCGTAVIVDPDDSDAAARELANVLLRARTLRLEAQFVNRYHRRSTAERLALVLHDLVKARARDVG